MSKILPLDIDYVRKVTKNSGKEFMYSIVRRVEDNILSAAEKGQNYLVLDKHVLSEYEYEYFEKSGYDVIRTKILVIQAIGEPSFRHIEFGKISW